MDQPMPSSAERIIAKFGGVSRLKNALGHEHSSTVQGWRDRGVIPPKQQQKVWEAARRLGIEIQLSEFAAVSPSEHPQTSAAE